MFLQSRVDDQSVWFEYDQSDLSSHQECSYTEMDNPYKNGKEDQEILSIEDDACTFVSLQVMQKMVDERASCKYCGGSLSTIEDNDSLQSLCSLWNFKCSDNLCESNNLPGHYMTPKMRKTLK